jgi:hypothetical protein
MLQQSTSLGIIFGKDTMVLLAVMSQCIDAVELRDVCFVIVKIVDFAGVIDQVADIDMDACDSLCLISTVSAAKGKRRNSPYGTW